MDADEYNHVKLLLNAVNAWQGKLVTVIMDVYGEHRRGGPITKIKAGTVGVVRSVYRTEYNNIIAHISFTQQRIEAKVNVECLVQTE